MSSRTVDDRVVEMRFDNKQFESGVQTSLSSLDKLKESLNFKGVSKGIETLNTAAKGVNLSGITGAVETVGLKFNALYSIADQAFRNITNSAMHTATKLANAFTIDPIRAGFQEYETQINSVQTILANTQAHQKQVSQEAIASINETAQASALAAEESLTSMTKSLKKSHKKQLDAFEELADAELEVLSDKYDNELDALNDALDKEIKTLKTAHNEKLALYNEEYMEKLKVVDEERYTKIKAIEDEIDAINALTDAEEEAKKKAEEQEKLTSLENAVLYALSVQEREKAEAELARYKEELARKQLLKEREEQIKQLELNKQTINAEYDAIEAEIKKEYEQKVTSENELYEITLENLKASHAERKEILKDTYDKEKKLLQKQIKLEREALLEQQEAELDALTINHKAALRNIEAEKEARIKALTESAGMTKASTLEDVNAALDELNKYADKTIYNFTEMTRNIGTFTAAGVDLETSVSAIKGIANLAALSGSTSQQASTAMYQLSQAISSGTVRLMDWNSVVNAGMGGQVFQDALKETARVHGIEIDKMIATEGSFRETLQHGWLTSEILTETLSKFTGDLNEEQLRTMGYTDEQIKSIIKMGQTANDAATKVKTFTQLFDTLKEAAQSGWTQSWEIIVGDFEEAKALLTEVSDIFGGMINDSAARRNELLQGWDELGGRKALIEGLKNTFEGLMSIIAPISEAFREIFPPITAEQLYKLTEGFKNLTEKFKIGKTHVEAIKPTLNKFGKSMVYFGDTVEKVDQTAVNIKRTFKGFFAILDIGKQVISAIFNSLKPLVGEAGKLGGGLLELTATAGDWLVKLSETIRQNDIFGKAFSTPIKFITNLIDKFRTLVNTVKEKFEAPTLEFFHTLLERVNTRMENIGETIGGMKNAFIVAIGAMGEAVSNSKFLQTLVFIWELVGAAAGAIVGAFGDMASGINEKLGEANFDGFFDFMSGVSIGGLAIAISKFLNDISEPISGITDILESVRDCFKAYQTQLKADALLKIASAIAVLTASILVMSLIDSSKLALAVAGISSLFAELLTSMAIFNKISGGVGKLGKTTSALTSMLGISVAILVLSAAMKSISELDSEGLLKGTLGVIALVEALTLSMAVLSKTGSIAGSAIGMVAFATAIVILASACKSLSVLNWEELSKGLVGVGALLAELVLFTSLTKNATKMISTGVGLIAIAVAMKIFASAMADFASMTWEEIGRGLAAMAGALVEVAVALNFMPKNTASIGAGLVIVGGALEILSHVLGTMGGMTWEEIGKGLTVLGGALAELVIALNLMKGTLAGSAALLVASAALAILAPVLSILGAMSWEGIAKGLVALAGAFAVIGVAGLVLGPIVPVIVSLAGAFALIGVGVLAVGAGLLAAGVGLSALAAGFAALATLGSAGATAVAASLAIVLTTVLNMLPLLGEKFAGMIITFCNIMIEGAPIVGEAFLVILQTLLSVVVIATPMICTAFGELLLSVLLVIADYTPKIIQTAFDILLGILEKIADNLSMVVQTAIDIVLAFVDGITQKLPDIIQAGFDLLLSFITGITDAINTNTPLLVEAMSDLFWALIDAGIALITGNINLYKEAGQRIMNSGLVQGIKDKVTAFVDNVKSAISRGLTAITNKLEEWKSAGKDLIDKVATGISNKASQVSDNVNSLIVRAKEAITNKFVEWGQAGKDLIDGFINGIKEKASSVVEAAKGVVSDALEGAKKLLGINSPSKEFEAVGVYSDEGLIVGFKKLAGKVADAATDVGGKALSAMSKALDGLADLVNNGIDSEPTIRPVLDLSNIEAGTSRLNTMFGRSQALSISASMTGKATGELQNGVHTSGNTYEFVQNNYSPKALSRIEIYRQTKNQFSAMERMVEG